MSRAVSVWLDRASIDGPAWIVELVEVTDAEHKHIRTLSVICGDGEGDAHKAKLLGKKAGRRMGIPVVVEGEV